MATRPAKTNGNTTYTAEVASGAVIIKATELDGDLNEIFTNITASNVANNTLTNAQIAPGANIATSKIAQDAGIQTGHLAPLAVTTPKLAIGGSTPSAVATATIVAFVQGAGGESQIVALPPFTPRGGRVLVFGTVAGFMTTTTTTVSTATFKLFRDGLQIPNALWTIDMQSEVASLRSVPVAFPVLWAEVPTGGIAHTYSLRCAVASGGVAIFNSDGTNGGMLFAVEFA